MNPNADQPNVARTPPAEPRTPAEHAAAMAEDARANAPDAPGGSPRQEDAAAAAAASARKWANEARKEATKSGTPGDAEAAARAEASAKDAEAHAARNPSPDEQQQAPSVFVLRTAELTEDEPGAVFGTLKGAQTAAQQQWAKAQGEPYGTQTWDDTWQHDASSPDVWVFDDSEGDSGCVWWVWRVALQP